MLPDDDPTEEVGVRDLMAALRDAIRSSPFGEGDDTEVAPFSASVSYTVIAERAQNLVRGSDVHIVLKSVAGALLENVQVLPRSRYTAVESSPMLQLGRTSVRIPDSA